VGINLTAKQLFQAQTIYDLSLLGEGTAFITPEQGPVVGPVPLTPIQHWFFEHDMPEPHHFNQSTVLDVPADVDPELLRRAVGLLMLQHDVLRARFRRAGSGWTQMLGDPSNDVPFVRVDLSHLPSDEQDVVYMEKVSELQASLHLTDGPVMRACLFDFGDVATPNLVLTVHHLCVDVVSWPIIVEDLVDVYSQLERGADPRLAPKTTSFKWWAHRVAEYAQSQELRRELDYWLAVAPPAGAGLPVDRNVGPNDMASMESFVLALDEESTAALTQDVPAVFGTQVMDGLIAALAVGVQSWSGLPGLHVDLEGHGREELVEGANLFATVGWFTTIYPVYLELSLGADAADQIKATRERLAAIPNKGIGYGILRYLTDEGALLAEIDPPGLAFNYLGRVDAAYAQRARFSPTFGLTGPVTSPSAPRAHLIEVNCSITHSRFHARWDYSRNFHDGETIEALAHAFNDALKRIATSALARTRDASR
jgi:non-ribosomal peptide synthase protein (TIGR01720 family)